MIRRNFCFAPLAALAITGAMLGTNEAAAQNETILAEVYGRGVHAYYAGLYDEAYGYLTSAIDGGSRDPRAYYFRGIVAHSQGRTVEAEEDWKAGAEMEAQLLGGAGVGRSLARFQGAARLQLEQIRQKARLDAMMKAAERSDIRMNELGVAPTPAGPGAATPAPSTPAPSSPAPPAPTAPAADDPFADDGPAMAGGQPKVEQPNALEGLDGNPFKDDAPLDAAGDAGAMPAGGDAGNPFGEPAPADAGDPFGGPAAGGADPFGGPAAGGDDPFGGNPFGN